MQVIRALESLPFRITTTWNKILYLAGGIRSTHDWRSEVEEALKDTNLTIINPVHIGFTEKSAIAQHNQIAWEQMAISLSDAILFWFTPETLCPMTLYELGYAMSRGEQRLFIGTDPCYARRVDVQVQLKLIQPKIRIHTELGPLIEEVFTWIGLPGKSE